MAARPLHHAVVAGGSIAGLLAVRVLSDHFERVTLVERDRLAEATGPRKGVPQGRHIHALLVRGRTILESLFPGLVEELRADGAVLLNAGREFGWHHGGNWRIPYDGDLFLLSMSRPLLEQKIARRVRALANVAIRDGTEVAGLTTDGGRVVSGLRISAAREAAGEDEIAADLVVDATGRGSMTPRWISDLGFAAPEAELIPARVAYATCILRRADEPAGRRAVLITGAPAKRSGGLVPIEGGRWLATLIGFFDEPTPKDDRDFAEFARSLAAPDIYQTIDRAERLTDIATYRFAGSLRRRYERLKRFPEGLIVLGDAVCSFNPVFGQGMTVSAIEAEFLDRELARAKHAGGIGPEFGRRWFRAIKPAIDAAWDGILLEDLRFQELAERRTPQVRLMQWYVDRVHRATWRSAAAADRFYRVVNFLDPPSNLFAPRMLAEVLRPSIPDHREAH